VGLTCTSSTDSDALIGPYLLLIDQTIYVFTNDTASSVFCRVLLLERDHQLLENSHVCNAHNPK
jgi:hypothetical protein